MSEPANQTVSRPGVRRQSQRETSECLPTEPPALSRNEQIIRLYAEGHSLKAVGEMVGMSPANVRYVLKTADIPRRRVEAPRKVRRT